MSQKLVISAARCMTAVGLDAPATSAATRAGVSRLRISDQFVDVYGSPIVEAGIPWLPVEEDGLGDDGELDPTLDDEDQSEDPDGELEDVAQAEPDGGEEDEAIDPYEAARELDAAERIRDAARHCFQQLLKLDLGPHPLAQPAVLLLGVAPPYRPTLWPQADVGAVAQELLSMLRSRGATRADASVIPTGNAAAIHALGLAAQRVAADSATICLLASIDSLLAAETLEWFEAAGRLKSESAGRNHGFSPGEGVAFLVVETLHSARLGGRGVLAEIGGIAVATEPNPFLTERPSRAEGITEACRRALAISTVGAAEISAVLSDLDGEFHRAKEWSMAQIRCFGSLAPPLLHPAESYGSLGAASGSVLLAIGAFGLATERFAGPVLVFATDDGGECGAVVLMPASKA